MQALVQKCKLLALAALLLTGCATVPSDWLEGGLGGDARAGGAGDETQAISRKLTALNSQAGSRSSGMLCQDRFQVCVFRHRPFARHHVSARVL